MAVLESTKLRAHLTTLLCHQDLDSWARDAGLFQRNHRKLTPVIFAASFVLAALCLPKRSIASTHSLFCELAGHQCAYSSFYDRIGKPLTTVLRKLFDSLLDATPSKALKAALGPGIEQVTALDTCIVRLWDGLRARWPSTAPDKAGLKLHLAVNVLDATPTKLKLGPEPGSEGTPWKRLGKWVKGHLLLLDRGYEDFHLFYRIAQNGGFFLTPLKSGRNPKLLKSLRKWRGKAVNLEGEKLKDILGRLQRQVVDVEVELEVKLRAYRNKSRKKAWKCRLIGIKREDGSYWLYLTNLTPEMMKAEEVWACYRLRWQVELVIRRMRQHLSLDEITSQNEEVVEAQLWASLCALGLVGALHQRLWPDARAEKVGRELMGTGRALAWVWGHAVTGRTLDLDAWLDQRMTPLDPHRTLTTDYLRPPPDS